MADGVEQMAADLTAAVQGLQRMVEDLDDLIRSIDRKISVPMLMTVNQVAELMGVHPKTIEGWILSKELRGVCTSKDRNSRKPRWRVKREDFESFVNMRATNPPLERTRRRRRLPEVKEFVR